jgi:RNA polymerase sigma factor (sigma-70 family)
MALAASGGDSAEARLADRRLVEAHRAGDPDAFAEIVQTHYASLLAYARRRLRHDQDAEDAVQETLLRAFRHLRRFGADGEWRLGPWLQKILANVCHDAAGRRVPTASLTEDISDSHADADVGSTTSDPVALAAVREAIATLPDNQRRAFELRIVDDLPYPEVALQMGITEDNARARVTRARSQLRRLLDGNGAVTGTLGVLPLYFVTSVRAAVRRVLYGADDCSARSAASITATSTGTGAAPGALSSATSPISSGMQLVGQLTASPVGQVAVAASAAGGGKGSVVIGLVASLATAGGLSVPAVSAISAPPAAASQPVSAQAAGAAASLQGTGTALSARLAARHASLQSSVPEAPVGPGAANGATSPSTGGPSTSGATSVSPPSWVALAASASSTAAASAGSASPATSATTSGGQTSTTTSASSTSVVSGGTSGAAGTAAPADGAGTTASTSSGSGSTGATQPVPALPTGTCSTVAGFSGVTADATVPPLASAAITSILSTGAVHLATPTGSPTFATTASVGSTASKATPVQVVVGTCLEQGGSLLAVDLTSADGTEAQLVGSLVAGPMRTGTDGVSYLFRGTVQQVTGGQTTGGPLPWGLTRTFVAELQVAQPADAATLTVAFMNPLAGTTAATGSTSSTSSTASGPSDGSTSPSGTGAPIGTGSGAGTPGGTGGGAGARVTSTPADGETATTRSPIPTSPAERRSGTGSTALRLSTDGSAGSGGSSLVVATSPTASN